MAFNNWAFIFLGNGQENPETDRAVIEVNGLKTTIVSVPDRESAGPVALELVELGAQSIELCGGFGPTGTARVIEATGGRVPVGSVSYGQESLEGLAKIFAE